MNGRRGTGRDLPAGPPLRCPWCQDRTDDLYASNGVARCISCDRTFTQHQEYRFVLHTLWSKARGEPEYDKAQWQQLETLVDMMRAHA